MLHLDKFTPLLLKKKISTPAGSSDNIIMKV